MTLLVALDEMISVCLELDVGGLELERSLGRDFGFGLISKE